MITRPTGERVLSDEKIASLKELAERHGVTDLRVFGSYARGEARHESDLDLLVDLDYSAGVSSRLVDFVLAAEALLGIKVDVVTKRSLSTKLHRGILEEARAL